MALLAGTRLEPYEVVSLLGAGGMGDVYRARDTRLHREVAIKVLLASFSEDPYPAGFQWIAALLIAADEKSYVYSHRRTLAELYLVTGLK